MSSKQESIFDKRVVKRNIKRNLLTSKEYEQYLKSLKDAKEKAISMFSEEDLQKRRRKQESSESSD
jgi:hypothetical protein